MASRPGRNLFEVADVMGKATLSHTSQAPLAGRFGGAGGFVWAALVWPGRLGYNSPY